MQSRPQTLFMAFIMALVGFITSVIGQAFMFNLLRMEFKLWQCLAISGFFSLLSIGKNYLIARYLDKIIKFFNRIKYLIIKCWVMFRIKFIMRIK
jgi:hypothetical protein